MPTKPTTPAITAAEARRLTAEHNARQPEIQSWIDRIHGLIRKAAGAGQTSISDPFAGLRCPPPSRPEFTAIVETLKGEGYEVKLSVEEFILEGHCSLVIFWG